jgi:hypothetical protein
LSQIISEENIKESDCTNLSHLGDDSNGIHNLSPFHDELVPAEDITVWIDPLDATKEFTGEFKVGYILFCIFSQRDELHAAAV